MDYSLGGNGQKSPSSEPHWRCLPPSGLVRAFTVIGGHIIERPVPAAPVASLAACHVTAASPAFRPFCPDVECPSQSSGLIGPQGASRIAARSVCMRIAAWRLLVQRGDQTAGQRGIARDHEEAAHI